MGHHGSPSAANLKKCNADSSFPYSFKRLTLLGNRTASPRRPAAMSSWWKALAASATVATVVARYSFESWSELAFSAGYHAYNSRIGYYVNCLDEPEAGHHQTAPRDCSGTRLTDVPACVRPLYSVTDHGVSQLTRWYLWRSSRATTRTLSLTMHRGLRSRSIRPTPAQCSALLRRTTSS